MNITKVIEERSNRNGRYGLEPLVIEGSAEEGHRAKACMNDTAAR